MKPNLIGGGTANFDTQVVYTEPGLSVGTVGVLAGRTYVWCSHDGAGALLRGEPLVTRDAREDVQNLSITTSGLGIGQHRIVDITAGVGAIAANAFNEGFLVVVDGAGEGNSYVIDRSLAFTAATADGEVHLRDAIVVASDADTEVSFIANKYVNPQRGLSVKRNPFVGVPNVTVPAGDTEAQYFWAQRNGYCPAFVTGTPTKGTSVVVSNRDPGRLGAVRSAIEVIESTGGGGRTVHELDDTPVVGQMVTDAITREVQIVDLQNSLV